MLFVVYWEIGVGFLGVGSLVLDIGCWCMGFGWVFFVGCLLLGVR